MGCHKDTLAQSWSDADLVFLHEPGNLVWSMDELLADSNVDASVYKDMDTLIKSILVHVKPGDHILVMSNGGFGGIHNQLLEKLETHEF